MRAIILAAGRGDRVYPLSRDMPKCLLRINGQTLLERMIGQLRAAGIRDITIVVGHCADRITSLEFVRDDPHISCLFNPDYARTNTIYSLWLAADLVGDGFVLVDGDLICEDRVVQQLVAAPHPDVLAADSGGVWGMEEVKVRWDAEQRIVAIGKDLDPRSADAESIGLYRFSCAGARRFLRGVEELVLAGQRMDFYEEGLQPCLHELDLRAIDVTGARWVEIDFITDYAQAIELFGEEKDTSFLDRELARVSLLTPGPVMVSPRVKRALVHVDIGHREVEFSEILNRVRWKLLRLFGVDKHKYATIVITGSGTAANECVLSSILGAGEKILLLSNGAFGERLVEIVTRHHFDHRVLRFGWANPLDLNAIERALASDPSITWVGMVHHETSTGMINPAEEIGPLARRYGARLFVDAVSSLAGHELDIIRADIAFCTASVNKAISSVPGLSFVCGKREEFERLEGREPRTMYLDLWRHYYYEEMLRQTPNTPGVSLFFALEAALDEILEEGPKNRIARYGRLMNIIRDGMHEMGLRFLVPPEQSAHMLTTVYLPEGVTYPELHDRLKERGFLVYGGKGELEGKVFQVATMGGALTEEDAWAFLAALREVLASFKHDFAGRMGGQNTSQPYIGEKK